MLPLATIEEIDRLLKAGELSQRKIAKRLEVSRGTVQAIATGKRGLFGREPEETESDWLTPASPPERCSECGFLVYLPCLVCRTRRYREHQEMLRSERPATDASSTSAVPRFVAMRRHSIDADAAQSGAPSRSVRVA